MSSPRRTRRRRHADQGYERSIEPLFDHAGRSGRQIRLLVEIGPEYDGYTAGAAWEKTANAFRHPSLVRLLDGYAVVTDLHWLHEWGHLMAFLPPFPLRVFGSDDRAAAVAWLCSLLRAGEALSSLLLTATSAGLAGMPLSLDPGGGALDDGGAGTPQIVARVGWPLDHDTAAAARTRRRDLASVLIPAES